MLGEETEGVKHAEKPSAECLNAVLKSGNQDSIKAVCEKRNEQDTESAACSFRFHEP